MLSKTGLRLQGSALPVVFFDAQRCDKRDMESIQSLGLASLLSKTQVSVEEDTESLAGQGQ